MTTTGFEITQFDYNDQEPSWRAWVDTLEEAEAAVRAHLQARIDAERAHVWANIDNEYLHDIARRTLDEVIQEETYILASWQAEATSPKEAMTEPVGELENLAVDLEIDAEAAYVWTEGAGSYIVQATPR